MKEMLLSKAKIASIQMINQAKKDAKAEADKIIDKAKK
jgi:F0F1-type ATP synthase membrane subunit b/b'